VGFATAPPRTDIYVLYAQYGTVNGAITSPKARIWLIAESADSDARMKIIVARNDPTGHVEYADLGYVTAADIQGTRVISATLADGRNIMLMTAPCVCGAGAVGYAGPTTERHNLQFINPQVHAGITYR
jgi:hypothetical protein